MDGLRSGAVPAGIALAPGRVNLIGEHTDYNDGFVLPVGIDRFTAVAYAGRTDGILCARTVNYGETRQTALSDLRPRPGEGWFDYVAGVAWALGEAGYMLNGADLSIVSDVPVGAGLASSASLEVAVARALVDLTGGEWRAEHMALTARRAENEFVGVSCGIMDQFAAAASRAGCAMLLDCRSLEATHVELPKQVAVVVLDTAVRRKLTASAYNERRTSCERAVETMRRTGVPVAALRDADLTALEVVEHLMDTTTYYRARHVVTEMRRPQELAETLAAGELERAGELMNASHESLRDLYEVSSPELDAFVAAAREQPGCFGARMTGAGFGGCAVALVAVDEAMPFTTGVERRYQALTGLRGSAFVIRAAAGARLLERRGTVET